MRLREMKLSDYYIEKSDYDETLKKIEESTPTQKLQLLHFCILYCNGFEVPMYDSLTSRLSYEKVMRTKEILINRNDFYAYRRKIIAKMCEYFKEK